MSKTMFPESAKAIALDSSVATWAALIFLQLIPAVTALGALVLILLRIIIAVQEYRLNRRDLRRAND